MNKTKIEWADYTWNPIKGLCPEACWYCFARRIYQRFGLDSTPQLDRRELEAPLRLRHDDRRRSVFACSTFELFSAAADSWREEIFSVIQRCSDLTFIILTKHPERIDRPMPENVYLGVTITQDYEVRRLIDLHYKTQAEVKFVSFEPLLRNVFVNYPNGLLSGLSWVIIGRLTGHGHHRDPSFDQINPIVRIAQGFNIPVFLKNNLAGIWPGPLIQEFPTARASSNGRTSAFQADDPGSNPGARSMNPKGEK